MSIAFGEVKTILFTWYLSPLVHSMAGVKPFFRALIFPSNPTRIYFIQNKENTIHNIVRVSMFQCFWRINTTGSVIQSLAEWNVWPSGSLGLVAYKRE